MTGKNWGARIRGGVGVLAASDAGFLTPGAQISRRIRSLSLAQVDVTFRFNIHEGLGNLWLMTLANPELNARQDYQLGIEPGAVVYYVEGREYQRPWNLAENDHAGEQFTFKPQQWYRAHLVVTDDSVLAWVWQDGLPEPSTWGAVGRPNLGLRQGFIGFSVGAGKAAEPTSYAIDDVTVSRIGPA